MAVFEDVPKPRRRSPRVTREMAERILYLFFIKRMLQHDIAALFRINQGRVSEVVNGLRFPDLLAKITSRHSA